jgi:hypothetical protein
MRPRLNQNTISKSGEIKMKKILLNLSLVTALVFGALFVSENANAQRAAQTCEISRSDDDQCRDRYRNVREICEEISDPVIRSAGLYRGWCEQLECLERAGCAGVIPSIALRCLDRKLFPQVENLGADLDLRK